MHTPPPTKIPFLGVGGGERREWVTGGSHWLGVGATPAVPAHLSPQVLDDLQVVSPVSDLGSLLLQVFPDFALQSPIIRLQAPHLLQVGGQAVVEVLHGHLLIAREEAMFISSEGSAGSTSSAQSPAVASCRGAASKGAGEAASKAWHTACAADPKAGSPAGEPHGASSSTGAKASGCRRKAHAHGV